MEPEALGTLFDRHAPALVLYARQWTATPEDVVQDAFVKLARTRTAAENVVPWLFRVVRNAAINAGRAERNRRKREATRFGSLPTTTGSTPKPSRDGWPNSTKSLAK